MWERVKVGFIKDFKIKGPFRWGAFREPHAAAFPRPGPIPAGPGTLRTQTKTARSVFVWARVRVCLC